MVIAPLICWFDFPTIDSCKINPFQSRKKKLRVTSCYEVAIYIFAMKVSFFVSFAFFCATFGCFFSFHKFSTRRHFTLFTIYSTPEKWYISLVVFNVLSAVVENGKSHLCFIAWVDVSFFFSISRGKFYTSIYYFLVASGNKRFFLKCPCGWLK